MRPEQNVSTCTCHTLSLSSLPYHYHSGLPSPCFFSLNLISRTMSYSERVHGGRQLRNRGSIPGMDSSLSRPHWLRHTRRLFIPEVKLPWREETYTTFNGKRPLGTSRLKWNGYYIHCLATFRSYRIEWLYYEVFHSMDSNIMKQLFDCFVCCLGP